MPRIPIYAGDRVATAPRRAQRFQEDATGTGAAALAPGLDRVAQVTSQIYEDQKQRANETFAVSTQTALNALSQSHAYSNDRGPDGVGVKGILTMQGREPGAAYDKNLEEVDQQLDMLKSTARTPDQQLIFEKLSSSWRANYVEAAQKHTIIETEKFNAGERVALLQSTVNTGAAAFGTPNQDQAVEEQLQIGAAVILDNAKAMGLKAGDAAVQQQLAQHRSKLIALGLHKLIDADEDIAAQAEWDKRTAKSDAFPSGQLLEEDAGPLRPKLAAASTDGAAFRAARQIAATTPRNADGSMRMADMETEAARQAGSNPKQYERTMAYLRGVKAADDSQRQDTTNANKWALKLAMEQGATLAQVQQMPAWKDAGAEYQDWLMEKATDKLRDDYNFTRRLIAERREDHRWARTLANEPLEDYNRAQAQLEINGADLFENIMADPGALVTKKESWLAEVAPKLGDRQFREVRRLLTAVQGNYEKAAAAKVDDDALKASAAAAGMTYAFSPSTPAQKQQMADLRLDVAAAVARVQQATVSRTGQVQPLSQEEYRAVTDSVTQQRIYRTTVFGPRATTRAQVSRDDIGHLYVRVEDMQPEKRDFLINEIKTMPTKDGTRLSELSAEVILQRYGSAIERAYAAADLRAGDEVWRAMLMSAVAGYAPAATPSSRSRAAGAPPSPTLPAGHRPMFAPVQRPRPAPAARPPLPPTLSPSTPRTFLRRRPTKE